MSDRARRYPMNKGRVMKNKGEKRASGCRWYSMELVSTLNVMGTRGAGGEGVEILSPSGGSI